jgi:hypothetical protein
MVGTIIIPTTGTVAGAAVATTMGQAATVSGTARITAGDRSTTITTTEAALAMHP